MTKELSVLLNELKQAEQYQQDLQKKTWDSSEWGKAQNVILELQREIAKLKGENYCIPWNLSLNFMWDIGVPATQLLHIDDTTFLLYFLERKPKTVFGKSVDVIDVKTAKASIAIISFKWCASVKIGSPNDEVLKGHPLYGKGLEYHTAAIVKNSAWIKEIEATNQVHDQYNADNWKDQTHYLISFKESLFECIATDYKIEVFEGEMKDALAYCIKKQFS